MNTDFLKLKQTFIMYTETALKQKDVGEVWGIGRKSLEKLKENNVLTAWKLRNADNRFIRKLLTVVGARIVLELRGIKCLPLERVQPKKQAIACSRSFGQTVSEYKYIKEAILFYLTRAAEKMRGQDLAAHAVTVFVGTDRFRPVPAEHNNSATYSSTFPTNINQELQEWTIETLEKFFKEVFYIPKGGNYFKRSRSVGKSNEENVRRKPLEEMERPDQSD